MTIISLDPALKARLSAAYRQLLLHALCPEEKDAPAAHGAASVVLPGTAPRGDGVLPGTIAVGGSASSGSGNGELTDAEAADAREATPAAAAAAGAAAAAAEASSPAPHAASLISATAVGSSVGSTIGSTTHQQRPLRTIVETGSLGPSPMVTPRPEGGGRVGARGGGGSAAAAALVLGLRRALSQLVLTVVQGGEAGLPLVEADAAEVGFFSFQRQNRAFLSFRLLAVFWVALVVVQGSEAKQQRC